MVFLLAAGSCGFLLQNKTGISSGGAQGVVDNHYLILMDALGVQKQSLSQMESFVLKLQSELKTMKQEVIKLKAGYNETESQAIASLKNETDTLRKSNMQLQSDHSNLKYTVSELNKTLTKALKDNTVLKFDHTNFESKLNIYQNKTNKIERELTIFSNSVSASEFQNITMLQGDVILLKSQMTKANSKIQYLSSNANSRSQDFLALLNQTKSLEQGRVQVSRELKDVRTQVESMNETVALTSCVPSDITASGDRIVKFPRTITSVGVSNLTAFHRTGKFTCEKSGVYLFSVFIAHNGNEYDDYGLYKGNQYLMQVLVNGWHSQSAKTSHSGSGTVVIELTVGDTLYAKMKSNYEIEGQLSCFNVIKIR